MFQRKWSIKPCVVVVLTMNDDYSCRYCAQDDDDDNDDDDDDDGYDIKVGDDGGQQEQV